MRKRVLGALLCLGLLLYLLPIGALGTGNEVPVPSEDSSVETEMEDEAVPAADTSFEEEGGDETIPSEARYKEAADGEWIEGTLSEACANVYEGGRVEILRDIDPSSPVEIRRPLLLTSANPDKPCKIVYTNEGQHDPFLLTTYADVKLQDIILDGGREEGRVTHTELVGVKGGQFVLGPGAVLQNNNNVDTAQGAGGLRVISDSTAVLEHGSVIQNCSAVAGGGAAVANENATLVLNGGTIQGCEALMGGGVFVTGKGKLYLYDDSFIISNQAKRELEGIGPTDRTAPEWLRGCGGGIFAMGGYTYLQGGAAGASIADNTAENSGGGIFFNAGVIQLANGSVTRNHTIEYGGGILVNPNVSVLMGNGPTVVGNTSGAGHFDNLYLDGGESNDGSTDYTRPIIIGAPLLKSAHVGVSRWVKPNEKHPYRVVAVPANEGYPIENDLERFYSDDPSYIVLCKDGDIVITTADVRFDNEGHGEAPPNQKVNDEHKVSEPAPLKADGYEFEAWYTEPEHENKWDFENDKILDDDEKPRILYAKWNLLHYEIVYELEGGENAETNPSEYTVESDSISLDPPTREGYRFLRWELESVDEKEVLDRTPARSARASDPDIPAGSIGKRTFKAIWEKLPTTYTVIFKDGVGGAAFPDQEDQVPEGAVTPAFRGTLTWGDYTFQGWSPAVAPKVTGDATYTAQWERRQPSGQPNPSTPPAGDDDDGPSTPPVGDDNDDGPPAVEPSKPDKPKDPMPPSPPDSSTLEDPTPPTPLTPSTPEGTIPPAPEGTAASEGTTPSVPEGAITPEGTAEPAPDPVPKTGDPTHTALWAGCVLSSLAGIVLLLKPRRRSR